MSKKKGAAAYVDGSYNQTVGICGYGIVFFDQDGSDPELISGNYDGGSWNVSGEIMAALEAVRKALNYGCESIEIFHDYMGISEWVTGNWQAKTPETIGYSREMLDYLDMIEIRFTHVKAHTGVKWNEEADGLNPKCRAAIERFAKIEAPKFNDYRQVKTYGLDKFSRKSVSDLEELLGQKVCDVIRNGIHDSCDYASALRWAARGLPPEEATHKANVDMEVRNNCTYR